MKRILEVCLVASAFAIDLGLSTSGQSTAAPSLQRGISVEMPVTQNAAPMPDADQKDALIVSVTSAGKVYVGVSPVDVNALKEELQRNLSRGIEKKLYVKADAQAPYTTVTKVLDIATAAGIEKAVLLTSQHDSPQPGTVSTPRGFTVVTRGCQAANMPRLSL